MTSIALCIAAFVFSYVAGRRSLVVCLITVFTVGYFYGILRANLPETFSHFIFDAAVLGLYYTQLFRRSGEAEQRRGLQAVRLWVGILMIWPLLLFLVPMQDYGVQVVGLRGNIFLLPFILLGTRLKDEEVYQLALALGVLNLVAFAFAGAEYFLGVERFFPQNQVTELIYKSVVDENYANPDRLTALRIPSIFTSAHAFGGTMAFTLSLLVGAWVQQQERPRWHKHILILAMVASILAVFMAAARSPAIILAITLVVVLFSRRLKGHAWVLWLVMLLGVGWIVSNEERLQRFMTLGDVDFVSERISWSVNDSFFDIVTEYPMGNGLGGGGTSMPYFLSSEVVPPTSYMENEYARIVLEQGVIGLCLWAAFIAWLLTRRVADRSEDWYLGRLLIWINCAAIFATGMIGKGMFTSIPGTALLLLCIGWVAVRQRHPQTAAPLARPRGEVEGRLPDRQYV